MGRCWGENWRHQACWGKWSLKRLSCEASASFKTMTVGGSPMRDKGVRPRPGRGLAGRRGVWSESNNPIAPAHSPQAGHLLLAQGGQSYIQLTLLSLTMCKLKFFPKLNCMTKLFLLVIIPCTIQINTCFNSIDSVSGIVSILRRI